ncbi:MAG: hypothetical protein WEC33_02075 [Dehalococcoidia bacterium]
MAPPPSRSTSGGGGRGVRALLLVAVVGLVMAGTACEKPGASHVTSPSAIALLGTSEGVVTFGPSGAAPAPIDEQPEGWNFRLENARFAELEDGARAIQVVTLAESRPGLVMEIWLTDSTGSIALWSGGETRGLSGTVCFQLRLESDGQVLGFPGADPTMTIAFRAAASGEVIIAEQIGIVGNAPTAEGDFVVSADSDILRDLLGCPRSVI